MMAWFGELRTQFVCEFILLGGLGLLGLEMLLVELWTRSRNNG